MLLRQRCESAVESVLSKQWMRRWIGRPQAAVEGGIGGLVSQLCPASVTPWTTACQALLSISFPDKNTGEPFPSSTMESRCS